MKTIATVLCLATLALLPNFATADEFGARFYNNAPSALGDFTSSEVNEFPDIAMDEAAQDLQNVMPAAGEDDQDEDAKEKSEK